MNPRIDIQSGDCDLCGRVGPLKVVGVCASLGVCSGGCNRPPVDLPEPSPVDPWELIDLSGDERAARVEQAELVACADHWRLP